jgi:membrane protein YdbS with pleckstrin-like domain
MPNDVKAALSVVFLIVAAILAYWRGSPIRSDFATYIMVTAVFMVVAMWIFPEAGVKKDGVKKGLSRGRNG